MIWVDGLGDGVRRGESDYAGAAPRACPARGCRRQGGDLADTLLAIVQRRGATNVFAERQRLDGMVGCTERGRYAATSCVRAVQGARQPWHGVGRAAKRVEVRRRSGIVASTCRSWTATAACSRQCRVTRTQLCCI
jgi:hypothetical protein